MLRPVAIALALLMAAPLAAAAAPGAAGCPTDPQALAQKGCALGVRDPTGACSATARYRSGVGYWGVRSSCEKGGKSVSEEGWGNATDLAVNHTLWIPASQAGIPDARANGTFHCALDGGGCALVGGEGPGPAAVAYNATPHWTVDTMPPTLALAWNGTVAAGDLDGDGAPDLVATGGCSSVNATASPPCGPDGQAHLAARRNSTGFFDITYRAKGGAAAGSGVSDGRGEGALLGAFATKDGALVLDAFAFAQGQAAGCFVEAKPGAAPVVSCFPWPQGP